MRAKLNLQTYSWGQLLRCELVICLAGPRGQHLVKQGGGSCCLGSPVPPALSILALIEGGILCAREHSQGQPALAKPLTRKERKRETAVLSRGSRYFGML